MKYSKIAVCISGELRTAIESYKVFKNFFDGLDVDVFIHTWTKTSNKKNGNIEIFEETQERYDKVKELYQPKKMIIQEPIEPGEYSSFASMFYSIMMANQLRIDYELENDHLYQWVVKYRFDLIFPDYVKFPHENMEKRTMYYLLGNQGLVNEDCGAHGISDLIFWGDSQIMTILCDTYRFYKHKLMKNLHGSLSGIYYLNDVSKSLHSPGQIIYRRAVEHNIKPVELKNCGQFISHTLWRYDVKHLDPFNDYDIIHKRYSNEN